MATARPALLAALIILALVQAAASNAQIARPEDARALETQGTPLTLGGLATRVWRPFQPSRSLHLVMVLHGDLAGPNDSYEYDFARSARDALADTVVIAVLRPGYADRNGAHSPGQHGLATGDNYTPEVLQALDEAVLAAKRRYQPKDVTIVGHSGGAALAADLAEADPSLAGRLLLVSCPCDVPSWRARMALQHLNPAWLLPVRSRSPLEGVRSLRSDLRLVMVVGDKDAVAPPAMTARFADAARTVGVRATVKILPGAGHTLLLDRRVLAELVLLQTFP